MNTTARTLTIGLPVAAVAALLTFGTGAAYAAEESDDDAASITDKTINPEILQRYGDLELTIDEQILAPDGGETADGLPVAAPDDDEEPAEGPDDLVHPEDDDEEPFDGPDDLANPEGEEEEEEDPQDGPDDFEPPTRIDTGAVPLTSTDNTWMLLAAGGLAIVSLGVSVPLAVHAAKRR